MWSRRVALPAADITIDVPSKTFDFSFRRRQRFLHWTWTRIVRRRFVVTALPIGELVATWDRIREISADLPRMSVAEICVVILADRDAVYFTEQQATAVWEWFHEANGLPSPKAMPARPPAESATPSSTSSSTSDAGRSTSTSGASSR